MKSFLEVAMEVEDLDPEMIKKEYGDELKRTGRTFKITIEGDGIKTQTLDGIPALIIFTAPDAELNSNGTASVIGPRELVMALACMMPGFIDDRLGAGSWDFIEKVRRASDLAKVL